MKKETLTAFIKRQRNSKQQTSEAVELLGKGHEHAGNALEKTWEIIFDHLCQTPKEKLALTDINVIAGIIYRLLQSAHRLKSLEHQTLDYEEKLAEHRAMAARTLSITRRMGMPPQLRDQLERDFNLI